MKTRLTAFGLTLAIAVAGGEARAQSAMTAAEILFEAGRAAAGRGDYREACAKFGESQRIDPAVGTLLNIADCSERQGKLVVAWDNYTQALRLLAATDQRLAYARKKRDEVGVRLAWLAVRMKGGSPVGTSIVLGGQPFGASSLGVELPVDPGEVTLTVNVPGRRSVVQRLRLVEGEHARIELGPGEEMRPKKGSGLRTTSWISLAVGGASVLTGAVTGVAALSRRSVFSGHCDGDRCPSSMTSDVNAYNTFRTVSSVTLVVGGVLCALGVTGLVVFPTMPDAAASAGTLPHAWVGLGAGGLQGSF